MSRRGPMRDTFLLACVFVIATCGLVYELLSATLASYLLGDSVTQFSLVIGVYLSAMGLGSYLSKAIDDRIYDRFIDAQLVVAVAGGFAAPILFFSFAYLDAVRPILFGLLIVLGTMVGLEIPLVLRILRERSSLREVVARVLALDYVGALAASVAFPLLLLPYLGLTRTSLLFGAFNAAVALYCTVAFERQIRRPRVRRTTAAAVLAVLVLGVVAGRSMDAEGEQALYQAPVIFTRKTPYQRITLTRTRDDLRLYLNGNLQFSSLDEYRYHEALVHPAMAAARHRARVLVLGGGDGLALREILTHPGVEHVTLVDLDPAMTALFSSNEMLRALNRGAFSDPRVEVVHDDALNFLRTRGDAPPYDVVFVDLPDPNNYSLGKLYSRTFYRTLARHLAPDGAAAIQASSPYLTPRAFWCIVRTVASAGLSVLPYHANVPTFGEWGFVLARHGPVEVPARLVPGPKRRFLDDASLPALFVFPPDLGPRDVAINRLEDQPLVRYYEQDLAHGPVGAF